MRCSEGIQTTWSMRDVLWEISSTGAISRRNSYYLEQLCDVLKEFKQLRAHVMSCGKFRAHVRSREGIPLLRASVRFQVITAASTRAISCRNSNCFKPKDTFEHTASLLISQRTLLSTQQDCLSRWTHPCAFVFGTHVWITHTYMYDWMC